MPFTVNKGHSGGMDPSLTGVDDCHVLMLQCAGVFDTAFMVTWLSSMGDSEFEVPNGK
jgi:hypothetical protein